MIEHFLNVKIFLIFFLSEKAAPVEDLESYKKVIKVHALTNSSFILTNSSLTGSCVRLDDIDTHSCCN